MSIYELSSLSYPLQNEDASSIFMDEIKTPANRCNDRRRDYQHKLSTRIINENQVICVESLAVKNMVQNHSLAKAVSDVGWGEFVRQLEY